jgi:trk system potassium uptake protein TrkH
LIAFSFVRFLLGMIILGVALLMLAPSLVALELDSRDKVAFLTSTAVTASCGIALLLFNRHARRRLNVQEVFLLTTTAWIAVCLFGSLPFILSHTVGDFTAAVFESVSAVTTTGATVLTGLDELPLDILLWRSMMQWVGGLGIVALGAAVLPFLRIGGMRLFRAESSDFSEKVLPQTRRFLLQLLLVYLLISTACASAYFIAGMSAFDAVNHAMTTVSTGGFSTHDASFAYFDSLAIELVAIVFMLVAAVPFVLYLPVLSRNMPNPLGDGQVRSMLGSYFAVILILVAGLAYLENEDLGFAVSEAAFTVVSIGTTTGYVSTDYAAWGTFTLMVIFFLTFVGGCSGSTSGGIKIFRFKIAFIMFSETVQRLLHPSGVFARSMDGRHVTDETVASVAAFALAFACTVGIAAILLAAAGNDLVTSFSAAATATANVGPGIGDVIGPTSNFASLSDPSKWIICTAMLLGRLEIFTALILFTPDFWRS